mmetsp:Transcript_7532/g.19222  ORF Transcript_7532/g.19222 Transcript_7532/m.19222 type:complete len:319 (+) Transcript_7532:358-1314(+)
MQLAIDRGEVRSVGQARHAHGARVGGRSVVVHEVDLLPCMLVCQHAAVGLVHLGLAREVAPIAVEQQQLPVAVGLRRRVVEVGLGVGGRVAEHRVAVRVDAVGLVDEMLADSVLAVLVFVHQANVECRVAPGGLVEELVLLLLLPLLFKLTLLSPVRRLVRLPRALIRGRVRSCFVLRPDARARVAPCSLVKGLVPLLLLSPFGLLAGGLACRRLPDHLLLGLQLPLLLQPVGLGPPIRLLVPLAVLHLPRNVVVLKLQFVALVLRSDRSAHRNPFLLLGLPPPLGVELGLPQRLRHLQAQVLLVLRPLRCRLLLPFE